MKYQDDLYYIDRILAGNVALYAPLVEKHKNMVFSIALRILGNREDAEEVAQDVFMKAYQSLKNFEKKSRFSTWLYRIAYNAAISGTRKKKFEFLGMNDHIINNYHEEDSALGLIHYDPDEQAVLMQKALERLPDDDHLLINLFYHGENTIEEISEITGLSESNVKVKLHRIRKRLYGDMSEMMKITAV